MELGDPAFDEVSLGAAEVEFRADEIAELVQIHGVGTSSSLRALASSEMRFQEGSDGVSN